MPQKYDFKFLKSSEAKVLANLESHFPALRYTSVTLLSGLKEKPFEFLLTLPFKIGL